jgi:S-formylglutathione hydrolase
VVSDLPAVVEAGFAASDPRPISWHSLGGREAPSLRLRVPVDRRAEVPWYAKALTA